ncbi:MAG: flippase-like domain-containing protein [Pseudomonadota bacterium]
MGGRALLAAGFVAALLVYLGAAGLAGFADARAAVGRIGWGEAAALLALSLLNYALRAGRWRLFTRALGAGTGWRTDMLHYLAGFALTATPAKAGEAVRLRWLGRAAGWPVERGLPALIADRAHDLAAMALLILLALAAGGTAAGGLVAALLAVAVALAVLRPDLLRWGLTLLWRMTGRFPRLIGRGRRAVAGLGPLNRAGVAAPALALGLIGWAAEAVALWFLLGWMGAPLPLATVAAIFGLATVAGGATGLPGGLGGTEAALAGLLLLEGVAPEVAVAATAIIRLTTLWFAIGIGAALFPLAERRAARDRRAHALEAG